jgi:hypothetical protein
MGISLTRRQVQSAPGADLLDLLDSGAAAGWLSDDHLASLRAWLLSNRGAGIPAIPFLTKAIDECLVDRRITAAGRHALRLAVESVMPPQERELAKIRRRALEADERTKAKEARIAERERARRYAKLRRPRSFNFMTAGAAYEGRPETIRENLSEGQRVFLIREPANAYDPNAVCLCIMVRDGRLEQQGETTLTLPCLDIGYVPRDVAAEMAPLLDAGYRHIANCVKILTQAARGPIPVIDASLYHPEGNAPAEACTASSRSGAAEPEEVAYRTREPSASLVAGWYILFLVALLAGLVSFLLTR